MSPFLNPAADSSSTTSAHSVLHALPRKRDNHHLLWAHKLYRIRASHYSSLGSLPKEALLAFVPRGGLTRCPLAQREGIRPVDRATGHLHPLSAQAAPSGAGTRFTPPTPPARYSHPRYLERNPHCEVTTNPNRQHSQGFHPLATCEQAFPRSRRRGRPPRGRSSRRRTRGRACCGTTVRRQQPGNKFLGSSRSP